MRQFQDVVKKELGIRIRDDLMKLDIPVDEFDIEIRKYSSSYYGNYYPKGYRNRKKALIRIYPYKSREGVLYPYEEILFHAIHESCHHMQYRDKNYVRKRGIMHNAEFYRLMQKYCEKAKALSLIKEVKIKKERRIRVL